MHLPVYCGDQLTQWERDRESLSDYFQEIFSLFEVFCEQLRNKEEIEAGSRLGG